MNPEVTISRFRELLSAIHGDWTWDQGCLRVITKGELSCQLLRDLEPAGFTPLFDNESVTRAYETLNSNTLPTGCKVILKVPKRASKIAVVKSVDELIEMPAVQSGDLAAYIVCDATCIYSYVANDGAVADTDELRSLSQVIEFWNLLKEISDHQQEDGTLLFFSIRKVEVSIGFAKADLGGSEIPWILKFARDLDREEVRREIFKSMLAEMLVDQSPEKAFSFLLNSLKPFSRRLKEGLAVYLSDHSPAKLQKGAEEKALSYTEKIDKLVSGMEAKSLTIPAALLVAYKEAAAGEPLLMGGNLVVLVTAMLYLLTMVWAHFTQRDLVAQLDGTVMAFAEDLERKGLDADNPVLKSVCPSLKARIKYAGFATWVMCICAGLPLLCIILQIQFGAPKAKVEDGKAALDHDARIEIHGEQHNALAFEYRERVWRIG